MSQLDVLTFGEAMAMFVAREPGELSEVAEFTRRAAGTVECRCEKAGDPTCDGRLCS